MRIIIAGAGQVGWHVAEQVSADKHDVTIIDNDEGAIHRVTGNIDARTMLGGVASAATLKAAGVDRADLLVAVTGSDEANIVCASLARKLGAARVMARVDESIHAELTGFSYQEHFGIDDFLSPEMLAALDLASYVRNPTSLAIEHFAGGALEVQQVVAGAKAHSVGKPLRDLGLPDGVRIAGIRRSKEFIIPAGDVCIEQDDVVTIIGRTEQVTNARSGFESGRARNQHVVIMGGGHIGFSLARRLRAHRFQITIIEANPARCRSLAEALPEATVLNGDGTSLSFLREQRVDAADAFISIGPEDEDNIMSAMLAKDLGVKETLVVINRPDYVELIKKMGIDHAVSPLRVMAHEIISRIRKGSVTTRAVLGDGDIEILEMVVEGQDFVGQRLSELDLPAGALVLTVQRGLSFFVPKGDDEFQLGDTILITCRAADRKDLTRLVCG